MKKTITLKVLQGKKGDSQVRWYQVEGRPDLTVCSEFIEGYLGLPQPRIRSYIDNPIQGRSYEPLVLEVSTVEPEVNRDEILNDIDKAFNVLHELKEKLTK